MIFAEGDSTVRSDDAWIHADVVNLTTGTACPGGDPSVTVRVAGPTAAELSAVQSGAPIRGFMVAEVLLYVDAGGASWLGGRSWRKSGGWGAVQAIVGPLAASGSELIFYDSNGNTTAVPANVARSAISVQSQADERVRVGAGTPYMIQNLVTHVALRNNPLY